MHDKFVGDTLAAWACIRLDRLQHGYRIVHLFDAKGVQTNGVLLVRIDFEWSNHVQGTGKPAAASGHHIKLPFR
jgi:hypothetical protein